MSTSVHEISNPSLDARWENREIQKASDRREFSTTADRILGLLQAEPITIHLTDTISMQFFPPTDEVYLEILGLQVEGSQICQQGQALGIDPEDEKRNAELMPEIMSLVNGARIKLNSINEILATLSVDKSWTAEKFRQLPPNYKNKILREISGKQDQEIQKVKKFRKKRVRDRAIPNASVVEPQTQ